MIYLTDDELTRLETEVNLAEDGQKIEEDTILALINTIRRERGELRAYRRESRKLANAKSDAQRLGLDLYL